MVLERPARNSCLPCMARALAMGPGPALAPPIDSGSTVISLIADGKAAPCPSRNFPCSQYGDFGIPETLLPAQVRGASCHLSEGDDLNGFGFPLPPLGPEAGFD